MDVSKCLVEGGIPSEWTAENLRWLAQAHRRIEAARRQYANSARSEWHRRWATLIEDVLETARVHRH